MSLGVPVSRALLKEEGDMMLERSCGAVVFTRDGGTVKYVVVEELAGKYHGFPKGHVEGGESEIECARREIAEEVGLAVRFVAGFRAEDEYPINGGKVLKRVTYFLAEYDGSAPTPQASEIKSAAVVPFEEALGLCEFENTKRILAEAAKFLEERRVYLTETSFDDCPEIYRMQIEAFSELLEKYGDYETNPGAEKLEKTEWRFNFPATVYYYIETAEGKVGAVRIIDHKDVSRKKKISPIFILKQYRNKGIAQAAITEIERIHGKDGWALDTILQESGNCHLYEKAGYIKEAKLKKSTKE